MQSTDATHHPAVLAPTTHGTVHTVVGAGQIGRRLARTLAEAGYAVRLVRRSAPGEALHGVTWLQGDITDPAFADRACAGAEVVYSCVNPPEYHRWDGVIQPLFAAVREAAARAGARLVLLDNLYSYGPTGGDPMTEQTPMAPSSTKGQLRKDIALRHLAAHAAGEVEVAIGRAADFFGAGAPQSLYGDRLLEALEAGRPAEVLGDPDLPRAYSYVADVALGLAVLGTHPEATGQVWHLPVSATGSTRTFLEAHAAAMGASLRLRPLPRWALRALGLFIKPLGAMVEMLYQWESPFIVDDTAFREAFGVEPTPLEQAVAETVAEWRARGSATA